jgi:hypothetical protein
MPIALLVTTAATGAVGVAVLRTLMVLRRQVAALHTELARNNSAPVRGLVPAARPATDVDEIRAAVAEALAEERERELAEARAFWAAQEARDASETPPVTGLSDLSPADGEIFLPRQTDFSAFGRLEPVTETGKEGDDSAAHESGPTVGESAELAAARRRHPSHPDFTPRPSPLTGDHERTVATLEQLASRGTELTDVRPGPLGTLDVYVFADGTTLCMTPGHRETAERLADAVRADRSPVLLGGSGVSGAYTLTFSCGEENVYVLADRIVTSV